MASGKMSESGCELLRCSEPWLVALVKYCTVVTPIAPPAAVAERSNGPVSHEREDLGSGEAETAPCLLYSDY